MTGRYSDGRWKWSCTALSTALSDRIPVFPAASSLNADSYSRKQSPIIPLNAYLHELWRETVISQQPQRACCDVRQQLIHYFSRVNRFIEIENASLVRLITGFLWTANRQIALRHQHDSVTHAEKDTDYWSECVKHGGLLHLTRLHVTASTQSIQNFTKTKSWMAERTANLSRVRLHLF